jgi:EAL domain-containing protein (putative c-di-GMP-specific phosphodiesterase class I)
LNVKDFLYIENALDRDLIEEMSSDKMQTAIAKSLITIALDLDLKVTA